MLIDTDPPLWHPSGAITPEKITRNHRKAQGRFGGTGTVPSETGALPFVEYSGFLKAQIRSFNNERNPALGKSSCYNVHGGVAPAVVTSPDMISMEIRGNLDYPLLSHVGSDSSLDLEFIFSSGVPSNRFIVVVGSPQRLGQRHCQCPRSVIRPTRCECQSMRHNE